MDIIHSRLANTIMLYCLILAIWGFWRFFRKEGVSSSFWGAAVIVEILTLIQAGIGVAMYAASLRPGRGAIHILYGVVSILSLPAVYVYTRGQDKRREMLIYAIVLLFMVGITLRAVATGFPPGE